MSSLLLAIDQGTTGSSAAFFEAESLSLLSTAKVEFPQIFPQPGWVEHEPTKIWESVLSAIAQSWTQLLKHTPNAQLGEIAGIGITNQRETVLCWNKTSGELAGNALVWQDRRTASRCQELRSNEETRRKILQSTGLVCDPYFSGSKIEWMLKHYPKAQVWAKSGELCIGTIDSYLIFRLTGGVTFATDHTNASRTMLYDLHQGGFSEDLLKLFSVSRAALPQIHPSSSNFGSTKGVPGLPDGIPIRGCIGDQQSALLGHGCLAPGEAKITYGTGSFILMHTGDVAAIADNGLLTTAAYSADGSPQFAVEGSAFIAGAAIQYLRDNLGFFTVASASEALALSEARDDGVLFVPAFAGLGAPYWNPHARAALFGLTRGTSKAQITRAVLESIAIQNVQLLSLMERSSGTKLHRVAVDGGAAKSDYLMQFQANTLQRTLTRPPVLEITARGAARAAQRGLGITPAKSEDSGGNLFTPKISAADAQQIVQRWVKAADAVDKLYRS